MKFANRRSFFILVFLFGLPVLGQDPPSFNTVLVSAKTAELIAEVQGKKTEKASFGPEIQKILRIANTTKLWSRYRYAVASKADIIIKVVEDRTFYASKTITLKVLNPDDNKEIYTETCSGRRCLLRRIVRVGRGSSIPSARSPRTSPFIDFNILPRVCDRWLNAWAARAGRYHRGLLPGEGLGLRRPNSKRLCSSFQATRV
jgi:hypothetical protein